MRDLFKENYQKINKLLNNKESVVNTYYYDDKISNNEENKKVLEDILTRENEKNLMVSQAGSGKTYSLLKMANDLNKLTIFAVPHRNQAEQIEQEYKGLKIKSIVGGTNLEEIDINKYKILTVVFDKLEEVLNRFYEVDNLIIDECQELVLATYREKLEDIEYQFNRVLKVIDGSLLYINVVYLTATPNVVMYLPFDNVFIFEQKVKDVFPKSYTMYKTSNIENGVATKLINNEEASFRTLTRLNNKDEFRDNIINKVEEKAKEKGKEIKTSAVASNTKDYRKDKDGNNIYTNDMYNSIINESSLPDADVMFCTSILDKGINLTNIKGGDLEKLECLYIINSPTDCLIDNLIQYESRIRRKYAKFSIMVLDKESQKEELISKDLFYLVEFYYKRLLKRKKFLEEAIIDYKEDKIKDEKIIREINESLKQTTADDYFASLDDSLSINDKLEIEVNLKKFFRFVYLRYNKQLYYNPELIEEFFSKPFNEETIVPIDFDSVIVAKDEEVNEILEEIKTNKNILAPSLTIDEEEKKLNAEKHNKIKKSWKLREYYNLVELGENEEEAIDLVKKSNKAQIGKIKNKLILEDIKNMTKTDYAFLYEYLKHKETYKNEELKDLNIFTYKLRKTSYIDYFEQCIKKSYDLEKMIKHILDGNSANKFLELEQYIKTNNKYINNEKARSFEDKIQYFIIDNIGKYENKDSHCLTYKEIKELTDEINKKFKENYTVKNINNVLAKIFKIGKNGRLNGLRTK